LLFTVRIASPRNLARQLGERTGLRELAQSLEEQLPSALGDDAELARAVDLDAPVDVVAYLGERDRLRAVIALGSVPMARAEDALAQGHRLTPTVNGARRITRTNAEEGNAATQCVLAPMFGEEHAARIVCADREEYITDVLGYLTRTLPRTPLSTREGDVVLDLASEQLRAHFADDVQRIANELPESMTPAPDPNNPALQDQVRTWAREQLARTLTQGLQDLGAVRVALRFTDSAVMLHAEAGFRALGAPLVQRVFASTRDARPSAELLNRLPAGGGTYGVSAGLFEPFRPELDLLASVATRMLLPNARLAPVDLTAVRTAFTNVARLGFNRWTSAAATGTTTTGADWHVGVYQLDAPAAAVVANVRATLTALRRPAVARAINAEWHVNPTTVRTPPTTGLPPGSLFVQVPLPASLPRQTRDLFGAGNTYEVLLVPDGNTLWAVSGADARTRYREARAAHAPAVEIAGIGDEGVLGAAVVFPLGIGRLLSRIDPQMGRTLERALQSARGGNSPLSIFVRTRAEGEGATLSGDLSVPNGVLGAIGGSFRQSP
jgi:hypothetical protein